MKVKELKKILSKVDDEWFIFIPNYSSCDWDELEMINESDMNMMKFQESNDEPPEW